MDYEISSNVQSQPEQLEQSSISNCLAFGEGVNKIDNNIDNEGGNNAVVTGTMRKRVLKADSNRSQLFFCGKRKRSNRDRYHEIDHSSSMPRYNSHLEECRMRPRSFSSTSKPHSDRLLPLNKGLLSKIERISQQQKSVANSCINVDLSLSNSIAELQADCGSSTTIEADVATSFCNTDGDTQNSPLIPGDDIDDFIGKSSLPLLNPANVLSQPHQKNQQLLLQPQQQELNFFNHRKKSSSRHRNSRRLLQFDADHHSMDCEELNDFSSSSLSSSDSENNHAANDTDREGDDELTDWPGNESICSELKFDTKRKLTKRNAMPQIKSDPESVSSMLIAEDDTVMSNISTIGDSSIFNWPSLSAGEQRETGDLPYQSSEPITIATKSGFSSICRGNLNISTDEHIILPIKQIESEMSGETSNPFLSSPPCQPTEVREIRAGCRRVKSERPAFSIKTSVNERLARFLQDPRQLQIRLPDIEIYEHESLINLATLYSLQMKLDNGCAVLNKTRYVYFKITCLISLRNDNTFHSSKTNYNTYNVVFWILNFINKLCIF